MAWRTRPCSCGDLSTCESISVTRTGQDENPCCGKKRDVRETPTQASGVMSIAVRGVACLEWAVRIGEQRRVSVGRLKMAIAP
jgi:hypothetical protein